MSEKKEFVPTESAKGKAKQYRMFAIIAWILAIAGEIYAITSLISDEMLTWLIVTIVIMLVLAITGSILWKKANKLDPASEKDKFKFFVQSQLGAIMTVLAFLPLVIFIFTNKDTSKKTKSVAGVVAIVALLIGSVVGIDFDPPSVEKYTEQINEQTNVVKDLNNGNNHVYWTTAAGQKYHLFADCPHIKGRDQADGTVKDAWEKRGISDGELCKTCQKRAEKERNNQLLDDNQEKSSETGD